MELVSGGSVIDGATPSSLKGTGKNLQSILFESLYEKIVQFPPVEQQIQYNNCMLSREVQDKLQ